MDKSTRALVLKDFSGEWGVVQEKKKQRCWEKKKKKTFATLVEGGILIYW